MVDSSLEVPLMTVETTQRENLHADGFCTFKEILDRSMLDELVQVTENMLAAHGKEHAQHFRYQGSNISVDYQDPIWSRLVTWPKALQVLAEIGFSDPKWWSAYVLSKPPHAPPLYWHQDWWAWGHPCSAESAPPQIFLMYYLTDTRVENGCLRVIPGTHRRRIALHDLLPTAHTQATHEASLESPLFCHHQDEVSVPVKAGDLVIGDARVLHAAHGNQTGQRRTCITLWYLPAFEHLPESVRSFVVKNRAEPPANLSPEIRAMLRRITPHYSGNAEPVGWDRNPKEHLAVV